jgi:hypothetical protein
MKKLTIITFILLSGFFGSTVIKAQGDDLFSAMEEHLTNDEKDQLQRAKDNITKGDKLEDQISAEDTKNKKYLDKKGKKAEKKSVEAKVLRVKQAQYYEKGYDLIYSIYSEKLEACTFAYPEDETKVKGMLEDASTDNASAKRKMKEFKGLTEKDLKKKIEYSKLKSDIQSGIKLYQSSIKSLISGYSVFLDQETKKQQDEEENRVWQNAQSENTILSYQSYLNDYPSGKYASDARSQIETLEELEKKKNEDQSRGLESNIVFQVQIAASKVKLSQAKISTFYKAINEVTEKNYDGWYKYSVGSYKTYDEAKKFVPKTRVKGAFVVAYSNDKKVIIVDSMKGQK